MYNLVFRFPRSPRRSGPCFFFVGFLSQAKRYAPRKRVKLFCTFGGQYGWIIEDLGRCLLRLLGGSWEAPHTLCPERGGYGWIIEDLKWCVAGVVGVVLPLASQELPRSLPRKAARSCGTGTTGLSRQKRYAPRKRVKLFCTFGGQA